MSTKSTDATPLERSTTTLDVGDLTPALRVNHPMFLTAITVVIYFGYVKAEIRAKELGKKPPAESSAAYYREKQLFNLN
jgi:hypothetical protein